MRWCHRRFFKKSYIIMSHNLQKLKNCFQCFYKNYKNNFSTIILLLNGLLNSVDQRWYLNKVIRYAGIYNNTSWLVLSIFSIFSLSLEIFFKGFKFYLLWLSIFKQVTAHIGGRRYSPNKSSGVQASSLYLYRLLL